MPFNGKVGVGISASYTSTVDIGTVEHLIAYNPAVNLTDGTGANQAKAVFADERTLAASATENLDLAGGLTDAFGGLDPTSFFRSMGGGMGGFGRPGR